MFNFLKKKFKVDNQKGWINIAHKNINHVMPLGDTDYHLFHSKCKCNPEIDYDGFLIIHNSFDDREIIEVVNEILEVNDI